MARSSTTRGSKRVHLFEFDFNLETRGFDALCRNCSRTVFELLEESFKNCSLFQEMVHGQCSSAPSSRTVLSNVASPPNACHLARRSKLSRTVLSRKELSKRQLTLFLLRTSDFVELFRNSAKKFEDSNEWLFSKVLKARKNFVEF